MILQQLEIGRELEIDSRMAAGAVIVHFANAGLRVEPKEDKKQFRVTIHFAQYMTIDAVFDKNRKYSCPEIKNICVSLFDSIRKFGVSL